jgi:hypothetical protein
VSHSPRVALLSLFAAPAALLVAASGAVAQTHARPAHSAAPAPTVSPPIDAGTSVVPEPDQASSGGALSPLNPAPSEFSDAGTPSPPVDYDRLLTEISALRARVAAVSDTLFHSRVTIALETHGDHARIAELTVSMDDGVVWTAPSTFRAEEPVTVYEGAAAPGHHAIAVDVERRDDRESTFRTNQRSRFIVQVPADQKLLFRVKISDDSSMGGDFPSSKRGRYDLHVEASAEAQRVGK